ncbi:hypothetical protein SKAU_G00217050 [Synaphobranchus kaupii]|uniref:Protein ripply2 n=1 Tax=Synaphobranchus kaupii TaxID=118154 RepID=A0A9Q1IVM6_SYNKA|nr:hypothetical protein SKAU_G00217050 [Synaphobranchus kaupii]
MDTFTVQTAFTSGNIMECTTGRAETDRSRSLQLWRPWTVAAHKRPRTVSYKPYMKTEGSSRAEKNSKCDRTSHPVKLFWPKSKCYDYLYQDAEALLRNYPVQATICIYEDSSSDDDSDSEDEKDLN